MLSEELFTETMSRNSVLEEFSVRRFAVFQDEIQSSAL